MKKRPQIFFADRLPPLTGGVEMHAEAFIRYFSEHSLYPITKIIKEPLEQRSLSKESFILFFNSGRWIEQMKTIRSQHPTAKIVYRTGGNEIIKAPLTYYVHSHKKRQSVWAKILNETVNYMITNSSFTENRLRNLGLTVPFLRCVGGVSYSSSTEKSKKNSKRLTFFSSARFVPYKNHHLLINIFNELHRQGREYSLILAGDGPLLSQMIANAKGNPNITFLGRCENYVVLQQVMNADIYIQLSSDYKTRVPGGFYIHTEGMGRSILEAISVGTFVVAGRCGALEEIITPEIGKLISFDSFGEIINTLQTIFNSPPKKKSPTDIFNWNYIFKQYENLYESFDCN